MTKTEFLNSFDEIATDPAIRLADVHAHVEALTDDEPYLGKYRVTRTSGTTGESAAFVSDVDEWATIAASYWRAWQWAGVDPSSGDRLAVLTSPVPWHQSARLDASLGGTDQIKRLDASATFETLVAGLNAWQPRTIATYASMARALANEQIEGQLRIAPRRVLCGGDVLTRYTRAHISAAWPCEVFDVYGTTEGGVLAAECAHHSRHLFEDLSVCEVVDEANRPVPDGRYGVKVLVTLLFARTMPLIRYQLTDHVMVQPESCGCGLPFRVIGEVDGRDEDTLRLPGRSGGTVFVLRNVFLRLLEKLPLHAWQVWYDIGLVRVLLVRASPSLDLDEVARRVTQALDEHGAAACRVDVERVDAVLTTATGKTPMLAHVHADR